VQASRPDRLGQEIEDGLHGVGSQPGAEHHITMLPAGDHEILVSRVVGNLRRFANAELLFIGQAPDRGRRLVLAKSLDHYGIGDIHETAGRERERALAGARLLLVPQAQPSGAPSAPMLEPMATILVGSTPSSSVALSMAAWASSSKSSGGQCAQPALAGAQSRNEKMNTPYETPSGTGGNQVGSHHDSLPGLGKGFFSPRFCNQTAISYQSDISPPTQCMKTISGAGLTAAG